MAVTINKQPFYIVPANNDIEFEAISDQVASANFQYYVTVTVESTSAVYTYRIDKTPGTNVCYFNLRSLAEKFVRNYYPFGLTGFNPVLNGIDNFTVNIGERYGATPANYAGTDIDIMCWNGALTLRERADYLPINYDNSNPTIVDIQWLNNIDTSNLTIKSDQDLTFYFLQTNMKVLQCHIKVYNAAGTIINVLTIANNVAVVNTEDKYVCINISPSAVNQLDTDTPADITYDFGYASPPFVFNTGPATDAAYYVAYFQMDATPSGERFFTVTIDDLCTVYDNVSLFYLNRKGAFDFHNFYGNHSKNKKVNRSHYKSLHGKFEGSHLAGSVVYGPSPLSISKKILSSNSEKTWSLQSDWLSDFDGIKLEDLIDTPGLFVCHEFQDYERFTIDDNTFDYKKVNDKLVDIKVNLSAGVEERRQFE
jgi:hypothetical protein